jgi:hypothetical protein
LVFAIAVPSTAPGLSDYHCDSISVRVQAQGLIVLFLSFDRRCRRTGLDFASHAQSLQLVRYNCAPLDKRMANVEMTHVHYRGGGPAINDLIPGRVDVMFATTPSARALIDSGAGDGDDFLSA